MDINELCDIAEYDPDEFNAAAKEYVEATINKMCGGDEQATDEESQRIIDTCVWRAQGHMHRLDKELECYKDPVARLNFVIARFWTFIKANY